MKLNTETLSKLIGALALTLLALALLVLLLGADETGELRAFVLSILAYIGITTREFASKFLANMLGIDASKEIEQLKEFDEEVLGKLEETNEKLEDTEGRLLDTQEFANRLLEKLEKMSEYIEEDERKRIGEAIHTLESKSIKVKENGTD